MHNEVWPRAKELVERHVSPILSNNAAVELQERRELEGGWYTWYKIAIQVVTPKPENPEGEMIFRVSRR